MSALHSVLSQCDAASLPLVRSLQLTLKIFPPAEFASLCALPLLTRLTSLTLRLFQPELVHATSDMFIFDLVPHLRLLPQLSTALWAELLKSATLTERLRALHIGQLNSQQVALIARLPSLQHFCFRLGSAASFAALLPAPTLASLSVDCGSVGPFLAATTLCSVLRQCDAASLPLVRSLQLKFLTSFPPAEFASLCALPLLTRLTSLTLHEFCTNDQSLANELLLHLRALPQLHTLRVLKCMGSVDDDLLRAVSALPSLQRFVFLPAPLSAELCDVVSAPYMVSQTTHAGWQQLHASRPELTVALLLPRGWPLPPGQSPDASWLQHFEQELQDLQQWCTLPFVSVSELRDDPPCCA